jgi:hypothetical protein
LSSRRSPKLAGGLGQAPDVGHSALENLHGHYVLPHPWNPVGREEGWGKN